MELVKLSSKPGLRKSEFTCMDLSAARVSRAKAAYTTRRVDLGAAKMLLTGEVAPKAGDIVLARVERIGQHTRIELAGGRRAILHVGDEVIVTYGARYAPDQFEAYVPEDLGPCDLVAAGGIASECVGKHARMKSPTQIEPIGLLCHADGAVMNMLDWALPKRAASIHAPKVFAVFGTMMNAGKTTCAANLALGLRRSGLRVSAAKVTGTGAGGDRWTMVDTGVQAFLDFTDAGEPSTVGLSPERIEEVFCNLVGHLSDEDPDVIVLEIADGLCQRETAALAASELFRDRCDGVLFAASDAMGAFAGVQYLEKLGHKVLAAGGSMTASPLAIREARHLLTVPIVTSKDLFTGRWTPLGGTGGIQVAPRELAKTAPGRESGLPPGGLIRTAPVAGLGG